MVDNGATTSRDGERVESVVSAWVALDRGWQATTLGLTIVASHVLWQVL
jgi:hypothetical protein